MRCWNWFYDERCLRVSFLATAKRVVRGANVQGQTRSHSRGIAGSVQTVLNLHTLGDGPGSHESVACPFHEPLDLIHETAKTLTLGVSSSDPAPKDTLW
jgi:hypothetical protein